MIKFKMPQDKALSNQLKHELLFLQKFLAEEFPNLEPLDDYVHHNLVGRM